MFTDVESDRGFDSQPNLGHLDQISDTCTSAGDRIGTPEERRE